VPADVPVAFDTRAVDEAISIAGTVAELGVCRHGNR